VQVDGKVPEAALAGIQRIDGVKQAKALSF
jgi:hypothetical protein